jgi:hypothetical protein
MKNMVNRVAKAYEMGYSAGYPAGYAAAQAEIIEAAQQIIDKNCLQSCNTPGVLQDEC